MFYNLMQPAKKLLFNDFKQKLSAKDEALHYLAVKKY